MRQQTGRDVAHRWKGNPLLSIEDIPFPCSDILNAGVVEFQGQLLLVLTVEGLQGRCRLHVARSDDGHHFTVDEEPLMSSTRDEEYRVYESLGIRDPRITPMDGGYYITYVASGDHGHRLAMAWTEDFQTVQRKGMISQVDVKNGVLFPEKIGGRYALLERPNSGGNIWVIYSDDLDFWGDAACLVTPRDGFWDTHLVGASCPPIRVDDGWIVIYYGERQTSAGPLVRMGALVLDPDDPSRVIGRSNIPILSPRERYERIGDIPNIVFSCGAIRKDDSLQIYYGASDSCICLAEAKIEDILQVCYDREEFHK